MPRKYKRKIGAPVRAAWSEEALCKAFGEMDKGQVGVNEISRRYGIPSRTLRRRYAKKNCEKLTLGKHPTLDFDNEKRLVAHIQKLEKAGFPTTQQDVRRLAFEFAEKLGLENSFNKETRMAGQHWLTSFLERHPELSIRQAESLSIARENDLIDKPDRIYNTDETGVQMNNNPAKVIATKVAKVVNSITSSEKEDAEEEGSTNAWSYYEREAGGRARCVVCRMVVSRADLKAHLKANHPKLVAAVDLGSDDDASDSQEDVYTEIVYLEEENAKQRKSISKQNIKSEPYTERPEPRKRQASSSSDEAALKRKKYITDDKQRDNNDEIEQFGKYVTCLLKKIPAEACMELQAEIINLIMKKQLELKRKETSVLAGNKMAATASDTGSKVEFENTPSTSSFNISNGGTE